MLSRKWSGRIQGSSAEQETRGGDQSGASCPRSGVRLCKHEPGKWLYTSKWMEKPGE